MVYLLRAGGEWILAQRFATGEFGLIRPGESTPLPPDFAESAMIDWHCGAWYRDLRVDFFQWPEHASSDQVVRVCTAARCFERLHERARATLATNHSVEQYHDWLTHLREEEQKVWDVLARDGWSINTSDPSCLYGCGDVPVADLKLIPCSPPQ